MNNKEYLLNLLNYNSWGYCSWRLGLPSPGPRASLAALALWKVYFTSKGHKNSYHTSLMLMTASHVNDRF